MKLQRLADLIRFEAGWKQSNSAVGFIYATINEVLREYTALENYSILKVINLSLPPSVALAPTFNFPSDLQHQIETRVRYSATGDISDARSLYKGTVQGDDEGVPYLYDVVADQYVVYPQTVSSTGVLFIDYYKYPTELILPTADFPIPSLEATIKLEVISRLSRLSDSDKSNDFKQEARQKFSRSQGTK